MFLQQRWVYLELAENYNLGSAAMARHMQVPMGHGKEKAFIQRKGKLGELCIVNRVSDFSWAEFLPGKKRHLSLSLGVLIFFRGMKTAPFWSPSSI